MKEKGIKKGAKSLGITMADIATQISEALGVALLEPERQNIEAEPTQNLEAYHYYLRGKNLWGKKYQILRARAKITSHFHAPIHLAWLRCSSVK